MSDAPRVAELDGLRGVAILAVMLHHFAPDTGPLHFLQPLFHCGWVGVDLFFVLSGYLITGILLDSAGRRGYYRNFIIRRSLRIFPLYYASLALYCVVSFYPYPILWKDFLRASGGYFCYLGNVQLYLANAWPAFTLLTPLWSLQVEEQFYLTFPLLVRVLPRRKLAAVLVGAVIAALAIRIALTVATPANMFGPYLLSPCRMDALALGGLIAIAAREWPERLKARWIPWAAGASAAAFVSVCVFVSYTPWTPVMRTAGYTLLDVAFAGVVAILAGRPPRRLATVLRARVLVWLGTISYGLYLLHILARRLAHLVVDPFVRIPLLGSADLFLSLAAAVFLAWLSRTWFEAPILRCKDRFTLVRG